MVPGASASITPVLKPATRAAAVAGSMVSPSGLTQVMSLLGAKEIETVSVVSMSSEEDGAGVAQVLSGGIDEF